MSIVFAAMLFWDMHDSVTVYVEIRGYYYNYQTINRLQLYHSDSIIIENVTPKPHMMSSFYNTNLVPRTPAQRLYLAAVETTAAR